METPADRNTRRRELHRSLRRRGLTIGVLAQMIHSNRSHLSQVLNNLPRRGGHTRSKLIPLLLPREIELLGWSENVTRATCSTGNNDTRPIGDGTRNLPINFTFKEYEILVRESGSMTLAAYIRDAIACKLAQRDPALSRQWVEESNNRPMRRAAAMHARSEHLARNLKAA